MTRVTTPKLYADSLPRFATQLLLDFLFVGWVVFWIWLGTVVNDGIETLATPGEKIAVAADDLSGSLADAGDFLGGTPVIGGGVSAPFESAADASTALSDAGDSEARAAERLAFWAGMLVAVLPILYLTPRYVPGRVRFVREATAGTRVLAGEADLSLFAWRAATTQPLHRVVRASTDPIGALERGDEDAVRRLARIELDRLGIATPGASSRLDDPAGGGPTAAASRSKS
jgi:hypothetical protein